MYRRLLNIGLIFIINCFLINSVFAGGDNTKIRYQGFLQLNGVPVNGARGFVFRIRDGAAGAIQWESNCNNIVVSSGLFQAILGESNAVGNWNNINWNGIDAYLEVRSGASGCGGITTLASTEQILFSPYGIISSSAAALLSNSGKLKVNSSTVSVNGTDMYFVPSGVITVWSGSVASIPSGWQLCDGTNGTPNLRDRFIIGAGSTYNPNDSGGTFSAHTHTIDSHNHSVDPPSTATAGDGAARNIGNASGATHASQTHTHTIDIAAFNSANTAPPTAAPNNTLPPYYALAFIMKM